ncbi:hypothetical protein B0H67DRAFT_635071 [Lasiosphaeris hirsuta]|uniref:T6SS Phospholipase effector Tle1-like catalytic domain-containing protein n=1 Tax=Lasiosphaeris hirsuta TaxID=260670 RepID=A0AA40AHI3_9PEZI|nr:hypothetical protein B0H67DRAFT_635071 [Lasiosphaeris hirsuta]
MNPEQQYQRPVLGVPPDPLTAANKDLSLVLCFDGTSNKYRGDGTETNVFKIFRLLDKHDIDQSGLGTYAASESLDKMDFVEHVYAAIKKLRDLAIGTSLCDHVLGGYRFLMRYYRGPQDSIYIFGFSRGAYTARFLAEMLDDVGLLPAGNEEMVNFAWKVFARWQTRGAYEVPTAAGSKSSPSRSYKRARVLAQAMAGFKAAFSRPLMPVRFLGLFDTVNSVPEFEIPWMARRRFPYSARSGAAEIWHAVSIDERRVKFRPDLIYQSLPSSSARHQHQPTPPSLISPETLDQRNHLNPNQQVHEVWFAGNHGDVGGGWAEPGPGAMSLSHLPLVWMVRAAMKAGLRFDGEKLAEMDITAHDDLGGPCTPRGGMSQTTTSAKVQRVLAQQHHDKLSRGPETGWRTALRWRCIEWLPCCRMDLRADGKWVPKRWPPSRGEARDIPDEAKVHGSVIYRMQINPGYRPHNIILGGGREPQNGTNFKGQTIEAEELGV